MKSFYETSGATSTISLPRRQCLNWLGNMSLLGMFCSNERVFGQESEGYQRNDFDQNYTLAVDTAIRQGLQYLAARESDGFFPTARWGKNLGICALAGLAFLSRGVRLGDSKYGQVISRIANRIQSFSQPSGFIFDDLSKSHGPMYEHAFATLFLTEVHDTSPQADYGPTIKAAVDLVVYSQNSQGGWRYDPRPTEADVSVTVSQIMALRAAKNAGFFVPEETIQRAIDYLRRAQNPDGGFAYQLDGSPSRYPLTAGAVVAMYNSGITAGTELDNAFAYLQKAEGVDRVLQTNYFYYAHYYSSQAFWHRGGDSWNRWYQRLANYILPLQSGEGGWADQNQGSEYATAMACLILNTPRSVLPIYQR